ncbi:MAG: ABC transporter permease [Saprospiraceae bacterium]|nr:ABC transporter permease [Saprospiraceae bacterium]
MLYEQWLALKAEFKKIRHSSIIWVTFIAFALAPLMGGVFMIILKNPDLAAQSGALNAKAQLMSMSADWNSFLGILTQAMGVGGVLIFGFVASWIFGREYSDGTAKDLLALPISRTKILNAKFIVYTGWCLALAISNLLIGLLIGALLQLPGFEQTIFFETLRVYAATTVLTILLGPPIAFFALWGRGYLAPLGFVALTLVFAQVIAATGFGNYFPWSIPGLYSGAGGEYRDLLNVWSYFILIAASLAGYFATILWWKYADQAK